MEEIIVLIVKGVKYHDNRRCTTFSIFNIQAGQPMAITGGIGEALIATASGLCVAILSLCVHSYLSHKMNNIITNMEQCFSALSEAKVRGANK